MKELRENEEFLGKMEVALATGRLEAFREVYDAHREEARKLVKKLEKEAEKRGYNNK